MKKLLYLFLLVLVTSCYKEKDIPDYPFPEYLGNWNNTKTTINGIPDDIYPNSKTPHFTFGIAQSEVTLYTSGYIGPKYQYWKVDKTTTPYMLYLYKETPSLPPTLSYKITKEPYQGKMELTYQDSIVYYLSK